MTSLNKSITAYQCLTLYNKIQMQILNMSSLLGGRGESELSLIYLQQEVNLIR